MKDISEKISKLRQEYAKGSLDENSVDKDPMLQFEKWMNEALNAELPEPYACSLGTTGNDGQPSVRIVLLRKIGEKGFAFFTNYESDKGRQLAENPKAAMTFFWHSLERQIRIEGTVTMATDEESDSYFAGRPLDNRIGAWASPQSRVLAGRGELEELVKENYDRFNDRVVDRPPHWGGYWIGPQLIEFWQGRPSRLHDRIRYRLENGRWIIERLAP